MVGLLDSTLPNTPLTETKGLRGYFGEIDFSGFSIEMKHTAIVERAFDFHSPSGLGADVQNAPWVVGRSWILALDKKHGRAVIAPCRDAGDALAGILVTFLWL